MSPTDNIGLVFDAYHTGKMIAMAGISDQYPDVDEKQVWHIWAKRHLGEELYNKVYNQSKCTIYHYRFKI